MEYEKLTVGQIMDLRAECNMNISVAIKHFEQTTGMEVIGVYTPISTKGSHQITIKNIF